MKIFLLLFLFFSVPISFEFTDIRRLQDSPEEVLKYDRLRFYSNYLTFDSSFSNSELKNESNATLNFINEDSTMGKLNCNFFQNENGNYTTNCIITQDIKSNFSQSFIYLPNNKKTLEITPGNVYENLNYNLNSIQMLTFGEFDGTKGALNIYFRNKSNYEAKKYVYFTAKIFYQDLTSQIILLKLNLTDDNIFEILKYSISGQVPTKSILNITSQNDYCLTDSETEDYITYCDAARGDNLDMKINSQIIFLSNSSISLTPKEQNIIIQGKIYENINLKNESKQFSFNYYKDGKLENISNCKMSSDKNLYKISCIAHKRIKTNFFGAHVDVTDIIEIIETDDGIRNLEENTKKRIVINGDTNSLEVDFNPIYSCRKISGWAVVGIVFGCIAVLIAIILIAIYLGGNFHSSNEKINLENSNSNVNP